MLKSKVIKILNVIACKDSAPEIRVLEKAMAIYVQGNVRTRCPDCGGALSSYEHRHAQGEFGSVIRNERHVFKDSQYMRLLYVLMRGGGCGRGGLAVIHDNGAVRDGLLETFLPNCVEVAPLPQGVPN